MASPFATPSFMTFDLPYLECAVAVIAEVSSARWTSLVLEAFLARLADAVARLALVDLGVELLRADRALYTYTQACFLYAFCCFLYAYMRNPLRVR